MNVSVHRLDAEAVTVLAPVLERGYAEEMARNGGLAQEHAQRKAEAETERLLAEETSVLYALEVDGERVGHLWLGERDVDAGHLLWVYDVFVEEAFRGRGFGREAMLFAETEARRRGLTCVGLNVFGGNETARRLYRSLGYMEAAVLMSKDV